MNLFSVLHSIFTPESISHSHVSYPSPRPDNMWMKRVDKKVNELKNYGVLLHFHYYECMHKSFSHKVTLGSHHGHIRMKRDAMGILGLIFHCLCLFSVCLVL